MMSKPLIIRLLAVAAMLGLASCGHANVPSVSPVESSSASRGVAPMKCYETKQAPVMLSSMVTFYGFPDNSPPGRQIAHPVIHNVAGGNGTWCNPTTFATEPKNDKLIPYGVKIYVPYMKQYFIREDDCTTSGPQHLGCKNIWVDLWIGGDRNSNFKAVINCEDSLTKSHDVPIVLWPKANLPVKLAGPIYRDNPPPNGTCFGKPGHG
jgi:hypothetical protein